MYLGTSVSTQVQTYAQIPIHTQIPAFVQLTTLFQPHVPSQPGAHLHHRCPATIPIIPMLGREADHSCKPSTISKNSNEAAVCDLLAPSYLDDWKSSVLEGSLSINSSPLILILLCICPCFNNPDPISTQPWVMWYFRSGQLFIHDPCSIKVAPLLYYTPVLILTKVITILSLWDLYNTWLKGLMKLKDWDYLQVQHISWSLVLPPGQNHGALNPLGSTSYIPGSASDSCADQFLTLAYISLS